MPLKQLISEYVNSFQRELAEAEKSGEYTPELSYRPVTHSFLKDLTIKLAKDVAVLFEPRQQGRAGRPDWRLYDSKTLAVYAYGEAKPFNPRQQLTPNSEY